jgi:Zn-ribbon protein, possibly nucleic acid-binding
VKASPQIQLRLLELADLDAELARLDHRRRGLPEVAQLAALETRAGELKDALVATETELGDLSREQTRAERDVDQVRTRIDGTGPGWTPGRSRPRASSPACSRRSRTCTAGRATWRRSCSS